MPAVHDLVGGSATTKFFDVRVIDWHAFTRGMKEYATRIILPVSLKSQR